VPGFSEEGANGLHILVACGAHEKHHVRHPSC
jgi:hypothetical protein